MSAKTGDAHFDRMLGDVIGDIGTQAVQFFGRFPIAAGFVEIDQAVFVVGDQSAVLMCELLILAIQAIIAGNQLTGQANDHQLAMNTQALLRFKLAGIVTAGGIRLSCRGERQYNC